MCEFLRNEDKLLLACAKSRVDAVNKDSIIQLVGKKIHWDHLIQLAVHHKLLPLLYVNLFKICSDRVPVKILTELQQYYNNNLVQNFRKLQSLCQIIEDFKKKNISVLLLKGPIITQHYYGDLGLRCYCDLDILVDRRQFKDAFNQLKLLEYENFPNGIPDNYLIKFAMLGHHGSVVSKAGVHVELHWELSGHYRGLNLTYEMISSEIEYVDLFGYSVATFNIEFLLIYLALHGQQHYWQKYDYVCCIAEVLRKGEIIDWSKLLDLAEQLSLKKVLLIALALTKKLFPNEFDYNLLKRDIEYSECCKIAEKYKENFLLINIAIIEKSKQKWVEIIPLQGKVIGKKYDSSAMKQRLRKYFVPQLADWECMPLPYEFHFLYYVVKPFVIIFRNRFKL